MATLTNTQISVTYVGLLKTSANTVLSSTAQQITDGSGNNSILYLSTAGVGIGGAAASGKELDVTGNVLVTGDLIVDNIKIDGNTISAESGVVTLANGAIATTQSQNDNSTKIATTAYVDTAIDGVDTLAEILAIGNTTGATKISVNNTSSGIDFIDDAKARFGTGNDAEIYGSSDHLYIDQNTADKDIILRSDDGSGGITEYYRLDGSSAVNIFSKNILYGRTSTLGSNANKEIQIYDGTSSAINIAGGDYDYSWVAHSGGTFKLLTGSTELLEFGSSIGTSTETSALMISSGNLVSKRTLGSNAFNSTAFVDGSGTANDVVMWSDSNTLTDAPIAISGNNATFGGTINDLTLSSGSIATNTSNNFALNTPNSLRINIDSNNSATDQIFAIGHNQTAVDNSNNVLFSLLENGLATFAGDVTINKASNPTSLQIGSSLADDPFIVFQTDGNTMSMGIDRSDSNKFVISDNATLGTNNRFTIDTSGDSTFAGNIVGGGSGTFASTLTVNTANSNILTLNRTTSDGGYMRFQNNGTDKFYIGSRTAVSGSGGTGYDIYAVGGNDIRFFPATSLALTLDTSANATFAGDVTIDAGASSTLNIYKDDAGNGKLSFYNDSTQQVFLLHDSAENFYIHAGSGSAMILSTNGATTLTLDTSNNATFAGNVSLADSKKVIFGAGSDLQIYHNGSNSFIQDTGTGGLVISTSLLEVYNAAVDEFMIVGTENGAVDLYHNGSKKFETTSSGVSVTGNVDSIDGNGYRLKNAANSANESGFIRSGLWKGNADRDPALFAETGLGLRFYANGSANESLIIDSSGNSTFAGIVTTDKTFVAKGQNVSHGTSQIKISQENTTKSQIRFYGADTSTAGILEFTGSSSDGSVGGARVTINADGTTKFHANILVDVINNSANSANIIYRSGTSTLVGGGTTANKLYVLDNGNVGIGSTNVDSKFKVELNPSGTVLAGLRIGYNSSSANYFDGDTQYFRNGAGTTERMRIDSSGGVGIGAGTIPADHRLQIHNPSFTYSRFALTNSATGSASGDGLKFQIENLNAIIKNQENGYLTFGTNGRETDLRIDSSGNLTLNDGAVTLNKSDGIYIDLRHNNSTRGYLGIANQIITGGSTSDLALTATTNLVFGSGGTTERMRITSAGDVNILNATATDSKSIGITNAAGTTGWTFGNGVLSNTHQFVIYDNTAGSPRMLIDSSGNVGIGETSPNGKLHIKDGLTCSIDIENTSNAGLGEIAFNDPDADDRGALQYSHNLDAMIFKTAASERMRITSGGQLQVGGTSQSFNARIVVERDSYSIESRSTGTGSEGHIVFKNGNGAVGSIFTNASATSYNTSSDYRLKEDLQDFEGLDMISNIPVYDFKWKADESRSYGVMAHELEEVLPQAVNGKKDAEEMQSVDYSKIVPLLVKSIQELKKEIEILKNK
jgi:hypothetical protein